MTNYQTCHTHYGYLTRETAMARELLERCGKPTPQTVKELRRETDMPMADCARMLRCMWRDMELERLKAESVKLRDSLKALMMGTYAELCTDRDQPQCRECSMRRGDESCVAADAMELLGIDMYGEPLGGTDG